MFELRKHLCPVNSFCTSAKKLSDTIIYIILAPYADNFLQLTFLFCFLVIID